MAKLNTRIFDFVQEEELAKKRAKVKIRENEATDGRVNYDWSEVMEQLRAASSTHCVDSCSA